MDKHQYEVNPLTHETPLAHRGVFKILKDEVNDEFVARTNHGEFVVSSSDLGTLLDILDDQKESRLSDTLPWAKLMGEILRDKTDAEIVEALEVTARNWFGSSDSSIV